MATTVDKKPQVNITFKKKEIDMFEYLKTKSSPANFIKDLVRAHMSGVQLPVDMVVRRQEPQEEITNTVASEKEDVDEIVNGLDDMNMFMQEFQ